MSSLLKKEDRRKYELEILQIEDDIKLKKHLSMFPMWGSYSTKEDRLEISTNYWFYKFLRKKSVLFPILQSLTITISNDQWDIFKSKDLKALMSNYL